jgi:hypothetical protein
MKKPVLEVNEDKAEDGRHADPLMLTVVAEI